MMGNGFSGKFERKFGRYAIPNLSLYLVICYAVGYLIYRINPYFLDFLTLNPYQIFFHGQIWRLVTWIIIPPDTSNLFFVLITLVFYYSIGTQLERVWGTYRYNVYLFSGMLFTVLGSILLFLYFIAVVGFENAYIYGVILMLCFFIPSVQNTGLVILQAKNKLGFYAGFYISLAIVSLLASIALARQYGGLGCAWATGAALFTGGLVMNRYYAKMGITMKYFWKDISKVSLITLLAAGIFYMIKGALTLSPAWIAFCIQTMVYSIIWGGCMWLLVLNPYEKTLAKEMLNQFLYLLRLRKRETA